MITRRLLAITAGTLLAAPASEVFDVRISLGVAPPTEDVQVQYADSFGYTGSESVEGLDIGVRIQVGITKSIFELSPKGQVILSVNGIYSQQSGETVDPNSRLYLQSGPIKLGVIAAQIGIGYAHFLSESTHLEILPFIGYGQADIYDGGVGEFGPDSRVYDDGHGKYREYGFTMGIYHVTGPSKIVVGLGFTYFRAHAEGDPDFNLVGGGKLYEHVEIDQVGISPWASLGMRF